MMASQGENQRFEGDAEVLFEVERTWGTGSGTFHDVEVDHGGGDIGMAEKVLDGSDVGA